MNNAFLVDVNQRARHLFHNCGSFFLCKSPLLHHIIKQLAYNVKTEDLATLVRSDWSTHLLPEAP